MNKLIQLFFAITFVVLTFSCSTIVTDEERTLEEGRDFNDQITQLNKQNKSIEEEILFLKNQLSEIQKMVMEDKDSIIMSDSERKSYQESFELIRMGDYEAAEVSFANYIKTFQDSDFIDDAKFWLAQSMYSQGEYNSALELFEEIQTEYPQSEKIMESILKAGFCHFELGNIDKSIQIFKKITAEYPNSSVARLAFEKLNAIN